MAVLIKESVDTLTGTLEKTGAKRFRIKIIDEGVGSSGTYPAATLQLAAKEGVFDKGVRMYLDHPTAIQSMDRPERTVKDLPAVLDGPAVYESGALYAPIKAFSAYADTIEEMKDDIGSVSVPPPRSGRARTANGSSPVWSKLSPSTLSPVPASGHGVPPRLHHDRQQARASQAGRQPTPLHHQPHGMWLRSGRLCWRWRHDLHLLVLPLISAH